MDRVLVGSQDVAHDFAKLKEHSVTHILNVAHGIANIFTDVSSMNSYCNEVYWIYHQETTLRHSYSEA